MWHKEGEDGKIEIWDGLQGKYEMQTFRRRGIKQDILGMCWACAQSTQDPTNRLPMIFSVMGL